MEQAVQQYIPLIIVLLVTFTVHEFAHAWTAYKLGDDTAYHEGRVTLNPLVHLDLWGTICLFVTQIFGWAKPVPVDPRNFAHPRRDDILVSAAGPFSNLVMGVLSALLYGFLIYKNILVHPALPQSSLPPLWKLLSQVLALMVVINFSLAFFNLLPIFPLDGSHIIKNALPLNQAYRFNRFNEQYGAWVLLGLVLIGPMTNGEFNPLRWLVGVPVASLHRWLVFSIWT